MKGSMRQGGSVAVGALVYLGADPVSGKQRSVTRTVRAGKREAQRVLNEMKVEAERGLAARTAGAGAGRPVGLAHVGDGVGASVVEWARGRPTGAA